MKWMGLNVLVEVQPLILLAVLETLFKA
jgi:hypothetical protein